MSASSVAAALLLLAGAGAVLLARRRLPGPSGLHLQARLPLGRDAGVALVLAGGERLLLGWGSGGVRLLTRLRQEDSP